MTPPRHRAAGPWRAPGVSVTSALPTRVRIEARGPYWAALERVANRLEACIDVHVRRSRWARSLTIGLAQGAPALGEVLELVSTTLRDAGIPFSGPNTAAGPAATQQWFVRHQLPGRLRLEHPLIGRFEEAAHRTDLTLLNLRGITRYHQSPLTSSVLVLHDPMALSSDQVIGALESALQELIDAEDPSAWTVHFPHRRLILSSYSLGVATLAMGLPWLQPAAYLGVAVTSLPILHSAYEALRREQRLTVDLLDSAVLACCLGFGYVFAGAAMIWVLSAADDVLEKSQRDSGKMLAHLFGSHVPTAWVSVDGVDVQRSLDELRPGDVIMLRAGEQVPVDGSILHGECVVDQQVLTGESAPAERGPGDPVYATTHVLAGVAEVRVEHTRGKTRVARIVEILQDSVTHKVRVQSVGEEFADRMVLPTFVLAAVGLAARGASAMTAILNADFGTGIRVAAPVALLASVSAAAKRGIIVKDASVFEVLPQVDVAIFDKTGTLTEEMPSVARVWTDQGFDEAQVLALAACAEARFTHPIASAIVQRAEELGITVEKPDDSAVHLGLAVEARLQDLRIHVGSLRYIQREGMQITERLREQLDSSRDPARSLVCVAADRRVVGAIELRASARDSAKHSIELLRRRGIREVLLISGDQEGPTRDLARSLGIERYHANALPEDKVRIVEELQAEGRVVCMVGDGINDSIALSKADVSFSLRGASDVAVDVADVVLMDGDLRKIDGTFAIAEEFRQTVHRSLALVVVPNVICIAGALTGIVGLGTSIVLNNGFNFVATANGMLPYGRAMAEADDQACQQ